jgi:hypothetical protein
VKKSLLAFSLLIPLAFTGVYMLATANARVTCLHQVDQETAGILRSVPTSRAPASARLSSLGSAALVLLRRTGGARAGSHSGSISKICGRRGSSDTEAEGLDGELVITRAYVRRSLALSHVSIRALLRNVLKVVRNAGDHHSSFEQ